MKKILYLFVFVCILSISTAARAAGVYTTSSGQFITDAPYLSLVLVNQNPSPANPGEYVDLLFKIENKGTGDAQNVTLELIPEYPFSLDPGVNPIKNLGTINGLQGGNDAFLVRYKVKVDKDAIDGENEIKLKYSESDINHYTQAFNVTVANSRTDFDIVAQDSATLAIANIGDNTAQSVIVRIPDQPTFRVNGTSATIIGNLNAGDYTLATFQIFSTRTSNVSSNISSNIPPSTSSESSNLTVEISYTDILGIRRTVDKNVSYGFNANDFSITGRTFTRTEQSLLTISNGLLYIIIGVAGIVVIVVFIKIRSRKKK
jgi:hypothetical protein